MEQTTVTNPRVGMYAGSFNPFHRGHLDVVEQAQAIFWRVVVARGTNPDKHLVKLSELPLDYFYNNGIYADEYAGLLTDYIRATEEKYGWDITLVRGLRNAADLGYEENMITILKGMMPELKVVLFICSPNYRHISSNLLRGLKPFSEIEYEKYVVKNEKIS